MHVDSTCVEDSFTAEAENNIFGRQRTAGETFGVYRSLVIGQAANHGIAQVCQDGGFVTALLLSAMQNGKVDAALVTGTHPEKPFCPMSKLAMTPAEILETAGSKYVCSQNPLALVAEAEKRGRSKVAFVGLPCQIRAFRRLQMASPFKIACVKYSVGLMCSGCFSYELVDEFIQKKLSIDPRSITKMNIKKKLLITTDNGVVQIPLSEISPYKQKCWNGCCDFSSELADISVGGLGLDGWTFSIIRSEKGEELFMSAEKAGFLLTKPVSSDDGALQLLAKLSMKKREH
jgi:coenzyme F420 hydrogenase subunit beta